MIVDYKLKRLFALSGTHGLLLIFSLSITYHGFEIIKFFLNFFFSME